MKFGSVQVAQALGAILAHSLKLGNVRLRKGLLIAESDIEILQEAKVKTITAAQLEHGDIDENLAAKMLAANVVDKNLPELRISKPFTGRVNIFATRDGVLEIDIARINQINGVSADITIATQANNARITAGAMVATIKIIPYGLPLDDLRAAQFGAAIRLHQFNLGYASLILTRTKGMNDKIIEKGRVAVENRLKALGCVIDDLAIVPHETKDLAKAIAAARHGVILLLTGSATSDIRDVGPSAVKIAGGEISRFGMPVDPGNLLFIGKQAERTVIGLPGCVRSPALNGADWVIERIACGMEVTASDIAAMGVGGLLKEIPTRPQPRGGIANSAKKPKIEIILLAAGASKRMRGSDKLLEDVAGIPMLRHAAKTALQANVDKVHVVVQPGLPARETAVAGLKINRVISHRWYEGMAASIQAGMAALSSDCDAVIIALADMPDLEAQHFNQLIAAFDPAKNHEICRANTEEGRAGLPVLFGGRFFETLAALQGDRGARDVIKDATGYLVDVPTAGQAAVIDLDTPQDWADWRKNRT